MLQTSVCTQDTPLESEKEFIHRLQASKDSQTFVIDYCITQSWWCDSFVTTIITSEHQMLCTIDQDSSK